MFQRIKSKLDSNSIQDLAQYFFKNGNADKNYPEQSGYYVGFLIAEKLARKHPFAELVRLRGDKLRQEIENALAELKVPAKSSDRKQKKGFAVRG